MNALDIYLDNLNTLTQRLSPQESKKMMREIGAKIRQNNRERIIANLQPDGSPMRRRKGSNKDYLEGYRKLRENEELRVGRMFIYDGPEMRQRNIGQLREMLTIKRPEHDKKYGFPYRFHKGGGYYQRSSYDSDYVQGFALSRGGSLGQDGVSKFNRKFIYVPDKSGKKRIHEKLMFRKINQFKYLKLEATSHEAAIGFLSGLTAYIAHAHQYGEGNRPQRKLLGFSDDDLQIVETVLRQYFATA